jgi:membrane protein
MPLKTSWKLTTATLKAWYEDNTLQMGAGLAYYAVFSIPPLLIITLAVMDLFDSGNNLTYIERQMEPLIGDNAVNAIAVMMRSVHSSKHGIVATLASVFMLFVGASAMFAQLQSAMNQIWKVQPKTRQVVRYFLKQRLLSFAMVLGMGFLSLISLIWSTILSLIAAYLPQAMSLLLHMVDLVVSFGALTFLFAAVFKTVPDVRISWKDVWVGATVTAGLYAVGKAAIGFYLVRSGIGSAFGAAGSILIVLAWIYYLSQILFLGAEFTKAYSQLRKGHL